MKIEAPKQSISQKAEPIYQLTVFLNGGVFSVLSEQQCAPC
jgi:hypothetical protein